MYKQKLYIWAVLSWFMAMNGGTIAGTNNPPPLSNGESTATAAATPAPSPSANSVTEQWTANADSATKAVDHTPWDRFLAHYLRPGFDGINRIAYGAVSPMSQELLTAYIEGLGQIPVHELTRPQQLAFWINLYNAAIVKLVLDHYPVDSPRDIMIDGQDLWSAPVITVDGRNLSLAMIEHDILQPIWGDLRTHYALNRATLGSPNLASEAYEPETVEALLTLAAKDFINHPRAIHVDRKGRITASSLYDWSKDDFEDFDDFLDHIRHFAQPDLKAKLKNAQKIHHYFYDWMLNDAQIDDN